MNKEFCEKVYAMVRSIPAGKVMGYGQVAAAIGHPRNSRHVGQALGALSEADIPWHRVVRNSGHIAGAGEPGRAMIQRYRLEAEGVVFVRDHIGKRYFVVGP